MLSMYIYLIIDDVGRLMSIKWKRDGNTENNSDYQKDRKRFNGISKPV